MFSVKEVNVKVSGSGFTGGGRVISVQFPSPTVSEFTKGSVVSPKHLDKATTGDGLPDLFHHETVG